MENGEEANVTEERNRVKSRISPTLRLVIGIFLTVMICISMLVLFFRLMEYNRLKEEEQALRIRLAEAERRLDELEYLSGAPMSEELLIRLARELGMVFPEEVIYYDDLQ